MKKLFLLPAFLLLFSPGSGSYAYDQSHLAILKKGLREWDSWRKTNPRVNPDLRNADLSNMLLSGYYLGYANLSGSNMTGARMLRANLFGANLTGANLTGANLTQANLATVNLENADLTGVVLSRATVSSARIDVKYRSLVSSQIPNAGLYVKWIGGEKKEEKITPLHKDYTRPADANRPEGMQMPSANEIHTGVGQKMYYRYTVTAGAAAYSFKVSNPAVLKMLDQAKDPSNARIILQYVEAVAPGSSDFIITISRRDSRGNIVEQNFVRTFRVE